MAKSIALAADPSRLASLLLSYIPAVCAFVAPRHPGASAAIIDRLSHSRALSGRASAIAPAGLLSSADPRRARARPRALLWAAVAANDPRRAAGRARPKGACRPAL